MLEALKIIFLGIVEGITEWLPISSTGHLILVEEFVHLELSDAFVEMFNVVIQFGAILAVILLYFHKLNPFSPKKTEKQKLMTIQLWVKVVIATIPAMVFGLLFDDYVDEHFMNAYVVAAMLPADPARHRSSGGTAASFSGILHGDQPHRLVHLRRFHLKKRGIPACRPRRNVSALWYDFRHT